MAQSRRTAVLNGLEELEKRLNEQLSFERYEYMERPEISQIAKGRATAFQAAALLIKTFRQDLAAKWPEKNVNARQTK